MVKLWKGQLPCFPFIFSPQFVMLPRHFTMIAHELCVKSKGLFSVSFLLEHAEIFDAADYHCFFIQQCLSSTQYCIRLQIINSGNMDNFQHFISRNLELTGKGGKKPFRIGHIRCGSDLIYFLIFLLLFFPIIWKDYSSPPPEVRL